MTTVDIIQLLIGSGGLLGLVIMFFRMGRFAEKVDNLCKKVDGFDHSCEYNFREMRSDLKKIGSEISEVKASINELEVQMGILETRVEERTFRAYVTPYPKTNEMS